LICEIQTVEIERRWHLMLDRFTQRLCGYIVGNSRSVVEHLEEAAGILPGRLRLIEGGVDIERIADGQPIPQTEFGCEQNVPVVMWVGRLDPIKGLDVLLEAIAQLKGHQAVQVALVGDGPMRDGLEARARNLEIEGMVHWLGMRSDVPSLLHSADVFAFPSRTEGLPNALLEAMAAGLPIVTTDAPGCRDLIQDGVTGLVAPVGDSTAMAAAIRRLLADRSLATALGGRAKERARLHFGREACCERYKALYRDLLSS
jgi:glycosyltransferase involved in cell wall biosynthesis